MGNPTNCVSLQVAVCFRMLLSVLELSPILQGGRASDAFTSSVELARHAERLGFHRFWVAEHHNIPGVASSATAVLIGHIAGKTSRIRVGSGGVMLPNHAPLVIAEQFGTLESLYPGRIDLGLGRAPGGDPATARALRRGSGNGPDTFPQDVQELLSYFEPGRAGQLVRAVPGDGLRVPIYLLGSSDFSARLAARLGLPFAFASHFAPDSLELALEIYRRKFQPSSWLQESHVIVGMNVVAADTDGAASRLFTSMQQQFLNLVRGVPGELQPPQDEIHHRMSPMEARQVRRMLRFSAVGSPETVRRKLEEVISTTGADEIMATSQIFDHEDRLRSIAILGEVGGSLARLESCRGF